MPSPITEDLAELFADTITVEPYLSETRYGVPTYGASFPCSAKVTGRTKIAIDSDGVERVSNCQVVIKGAFGVSPQDRYTLPVRFSINPLATTPEGLLEGRQPRAIAVDQESDENGAHHETVYFAITPKNRVF